MHSTFPPDSPLRVNVMLLPERLFTWSLFHRDVSANSFPTAFDCSALASNHITQGGLNG
jgi:hypothetical protein